MDPFLVEVDVLDLQKWFHSNVIVTVKMAAIELLLFFFYLGVELVI